MLFQKNRLRNAAILMVVWGLIGCVETRIYMAVRSDGAGTVTIQQVVPGPLASDSKYVDIETNNLLLRDLAEVQAIWGDRPGIRIQSFTTREVEQQPHNFGNTSFGKTMLTTTILDFDHVRDLSLEHFSFDYYPVGDKKYFAFHVDKNIAGTHLDSAYGGMGQILSSLVRDRTVEIQVELPSRVSDTNADEIIWKTATWRLPVGVLFNKVQQDVTGWAQIKGTSGLTLEKVSFWLRNLFETDAWRSPENQAQYFVLPVDEKALEAR